ncbi:uncharacterized protein troap isoform X2 [Phycodurus eques]|uniref:uncharacterized protein troap isoform X2 n=1 Tax=Phycodurus eques TaxID=693459 RepID=UPI002ACDE6A9|nr:uncharacterized protein troap isoform X2 [Phycodurus eques]
MDGSPVLRVQRQDEISAYLRRVNNEKNRITPVPKNSKPVPVPAPKFPTRDSEDQDPGRKPPVRPSRIPVLVKSLRHSTAFHAAQWEQRLLAGKAKKAKSCTRSTPFNMSRHKSLTIDVTSQPKSGAHSVQSENNFCIKTPKAKENPLKCPAVLKSTVAAAKENCRSHGMDPGPFETLKTENVTHQKSSSSSSSSVCLDKMTHLSLKDPIDISNPSGNAQDNLSSDPCDAAEAFQPNQAALLSVLCNEGVRIFSEPFATPHSKSDAMFPQRVSVVKSHQKTPASVKKGGGLCMPHVCQISKLMTFIDTPQRVPTNKSVAALDKAMEFQPNPSSLLNILRHEDVCICSQSNATPRSQSYAMFPQRVSVAKTLQKAAASQSDGVKAAGPMRASAQKPSFRDVFFDTPQRLPIKKSPAASEFQTDPSSLLSILHNRGVCISSQSTATPRSQSYAMFPQRVSVAKSHQKAAASQNKGVKGTGPVRVTPQKPFGRGTVFGTQVVQTLFVDQEDGQCPDNREKKLPVLQALPIKSHCEDKGKMSDIQGNQEARMIEEAQQSIPTLQRESVIFFSTGKKQLHFEKHESLTCQEGPSQDLSDVEDVCELVSCIKPARHSLQGDQKAFVTNTALALLPKRLLPLEDLRLDHEIAFYTSHSIADAPRFLPSQPRCRDPVASLRHFEESTIFFPLNLDASSLCSSPPQENELSDVAFS